MKTSHNSLSSFLLPALSLSNGPLSSRKDGFTLIELIVAIGVFSTIVSIAVGGFVSALRTQRQTVALIAANSNASLTMEQMAREIRAGFDFCLPGQCIGTSELSFKNAAGDVVTYRLNGVSGAVERGISGNFSPLTAENVSIRYLHFVLSGNDSRDGLSPRITVSMGVSSKELGVAGSVVNIQTTVSARVLDG